MKKIILSSIFLVLFNFINAQDINKRCKEESTIGNVKLVGCIDVEGKLHGYGTYALTDGTLIIKGMWRRGKLNGEGIKTILADSQTQNYKGIFKNDILFDGEIEIVFKRGDLRVQKYVDGKIKSTKYTWIDGSIKETSGIHYKSGDLKNGVEKTISIDNSIMSSFYENGEIIDQRKNTSNYYNNEEILGDSESITIPLEIEEGEDTMYVSLNIPTKKDTNYSARFIYDTGAEVFSLGYRLFNDLKENGLDFVDLNVNITVVGVSGVPSQNNAIIIKELNLGSYTVKNVVALVETLESANSSLLGMGFLNKFKEVKWSLIAKELVFYK